MHIRLQVAGRGSKHSTHECRRRRRARTVNPPPPRIVEQLQACSVNESFMTAPVQTKLQVSGRGSKHSPQKCRWQRQACTLHPQPPRAVEQLQACSISWLIVAAPVLTKMQAAGRGGKHYEHAPSIRHCRARWSTRKLAQSMNPSWRHRCRPNCRCLVLVASNLHTSASGRDEHAPCMRHHLVLWSSRKLARSAG